METQQKELKVTFFITGQDDKSKAIHTGDLFKNSWDKYFTGTEKVEALTETKVIGENKSKKLVFKLMDFDSNDEVFFGYVGIYRDTFLPSVFNKKSFQDSPIPLNTDDEVLEKSYFLYFIKQDILVFHQNHLGPRADDLAFMLFKANDLSRIHFDPIWKKNNVKELLETNSILRKGTVTLALPRKFDLTDLDLNNSWSKEIICMMSRTGMSRMTIGFWGRASTKKGVVGYVVDEVKNGVQEFVSKFSVSERANQPTLHKANVQMKDGNVENLLEQELSTKVDIVVENGYPKIVDVKIGLRRAMLKCKDSLDAYSLEKKDFA
jgi:hypothetical protein